MKNGAKRREQKGSKKGVKRATVINPIIPVPRCSHESFATEFRSLRTSGLRKRMRGCGAAEPPLVPFKSTAAIKKHYLRKKGLKS
jgi:hypothetical protein